MDGVSLNVGRQSLGAVNIEMLKKTKNIVASQVMELVQSIQSQSPNGGGVGGKIDISA